MPEKEPLQSPTVIASSTPEELVPSTAGVLLVDAEMLLAGLLQLKDRIPDYTHLTARESRGMGRTANLDPEFVSAGLHTVSSTPNAKEFWGWSGEELRQLADDARRWDDVERELRIVLKGITDANRKRKNSLGFAILFVYGLLRRLAKKRGTEWLRPYYDEMHAAWKRSRERRRTKKEDSKDE